MGRGRGKIALGAAAIVTIATAPLWARYVAFFDVRQVEVLGNRYLDAGAIVAQLGLGADHNLFESVGPLEEAIAGIPGVREVEIERRLPATLRIAIIERQPVALVPGIDGMIALDSEARPLPYDPAAVSLDLPIAATSDRGLTRAMALVRNVDAEMYSEMVAARLDGSGTIVLEFADLEVLLPAPPTASDILKVTAVRSHVVAGGDEFDRLDSRFDGQVVARRVRV